MKLSDLAAKYSRKFGPIESDDVADESGLPLWQSAAIADRRSPSVVLTADRNTDTLLHSVSSLERLATAISPLY